MSVPSISKDQTLLSSHQRPRLPSLQERFGENSKFLSEVGMKTNFFLEIWHILQLELEIIRFVTDSVVSSSLWLIWAYSVIIPNRIEVHFSIASVTWFLLDRICIKLSIENQQDIFFIPSIEGKSDAVWDICHLTMTILSIKKDICHSWWTIQSDLVQIFYTHLRILSLLMYVSYPTDLIYDWLTMKGLDTVESLSAGTMWDPKFLP